MAPGIRAGGGAAEQYSRDLPSLVHLYDTYLRHFGGAGGHGGGHVFDAGGQGGRGGSAGGMSHGFGGGGGGHGGQQHDPLTQAEEIRIAKMQAAMSSVDADPQLSEQDKYRYKMEIRAGLDPLLQRQQEAKLRMQKMQEEDMQRAHAHAASMEQGQAESRAQGFPHTSVYANGHRFVQSPDGKWHAYKDDSAEKAEKARIAQEQRIEKAQLQKRKDMAIAHQRAIKEFERKGKTDATDDEVDERAGEIYKLYRQQLTPAPGDADYVGPAKVDPYQGAQPDQGQQTQGQADPAMIQEPGQQPQPAPMAMPQSVGQRLFGKKAEMRQAPLGTEFNGVPEGPQANAESAPEGTYITGQGTKDEKWHKPLNVAPPESDAEEGDTEE